VTSLRRVVAFAGAFLALAIVVGVYFPKLLRLSAGAPTEIITQLAGTSKPGIELDVLGQKLVSSNHHFDRVTVTVDEAARNAVASATLDFDGRYAGATDVSSLGVERVPFVYEGGEWKPQAGWAPRLAAIVGALEARRRALTAGDWAALGKLAGGDVSGDPELKRVVAVGQRSYAAVKWFIRSERDEVIVTEQFRLTGSTPERPIDEEGTRRLSLKPVGREFFFSQGLM
jgi:hypothetical protein